MKKKILSLTLALAMCLGLAIPAFAVDTSGLDAKTAAEYYRVLWEQIQANGIRENKDGQGIAYANLVDMDTDGTPELIIIGFGMDWMLDIGIWKIKNGSAVQTSGDCGTIGAEKGYVSFARKNGRIRLFYDYYWSYREFDGHDLALIDADGTCEKSDYINSGDGSVASPEDVTYDKSWIVDSTPILKVENSITWDYNDSQPRAVNDLLTALKTKATAATSTAPAAGTYGPYTITGTDHAGSLYTISLSAAKVEKKTVQYRTSDSIEYPSYGPYRPYTVTLVTIRPDTKVTVTGNNLDDYFGLPVGGCGSADGNNKYTDEVQGVPAYIHSGMGKKSFECDYTPDYVQIGDYLIVEDSTPAPSTSGGFTDVKAGAYYEEPVKWAVKKTSPAALAQRHSAPTAPAPWRRF